MTLQHAPDISIVCALLAVGGASLGGCASAIPIGFDEDAPDGRIQAIIGAAREMDTTKVPELIDQLDSDDPATRMFAIRALERITGQTMGYQHEGPIEERKAAIERWVRWHNGTSTRANR